MTYDEFKRIEPKLAHGLWLHFGHYPIDGVYENEGRWEAHLATPPHGDFEIVREARCKPNCISGAGYRRSWVTEDHACCEACEVDPMHRYETVHE